MADTTTILRYEVSGNIGDDGFNFELSTPGLTDECVLALGNAIKGLPWPAGIGCSVSLFRSVQNISTTSGHLAAVPPVFS